MWSAPLQPKRKKKSLKVFTKCEAAVTFDPQNLITGFSSPPRSEFASNREKLPEGMWLHWPLTSKTDLAHTWVQGDEQSAKAAAPRPLTTVSLDLIRLSVRQCWRFFFLRYSAQDDTETDHLLAIRRTVQTIPGRTNWLQQIMSSAVYNSVTWRET